MLENKLTGNWKFRQLGTDKFYKAEVPGDVTIDYYKNGLIEDPYTGMHYVDSKWILDEDFEYVNEFELDKSCFDYEKINLYLKGVDTYSDVYVNGEYVGKTENMFIEYKFDIKKFANKGKNELKIILHSTLKKMETFDVKDYFATFNVPRLFVRKAQCHFGWDWAPNLPGYGIWQEVYVRAEHADVIDTVNYWPKMDGTVTFFADLTYNVRLKPHTEFRKTDTLKFYLSKTPNQPLDESDCYLEEIEVTGSKNFITMKIENPALWWPSGFGEPNLYHYRVELLRNGEVTDERHGRLGLREVELVEEPTSKTSFGYTIRINKQNIFCKGSNWVPIECFTGVVKDEKYRELIQLSKDGNFNMLRVWGGGIYEKDIFYDLCDEMGIMVWQDFMFACADMPEEDEEFVRLALLDCEYNIKRLRTHPSLVYWCGGNEKTGAFGLMIQHGDFFVDTTLKGLVGTLDRTRPYARQSPCSFTDVANDNNSGESHAGSWNEGLAKGYAAFRKKVAETEVSFSSECAVMGPCCKKSFIKFLPPDKVWPTNEVWIDRFLFNPYSDSKLTFVDNEKIIAKELFGDFKGIDDFIIKSMTIHGETLKTEIEFSRSQKWNNSGFMNWMLTDIWPTGTWAIIDYYLECKMAYYLMKKAYEPLHIAYVQNKEEEQVLMLLNDSLKSYKGSVEYGQKTLDGKILWSETLEGVKLPANTNLEIAKAKVIDNKNSYLYAYYKAGKAKTETTYFPQLWKDVQFESDYTVSFGRVKKSGDYYEVTATVKANKYLRTVVFDIEGHGLYSDNYFDVEAGASKQVTIRSSEKFKIKDITVSDFIKIIKE